jgi:erythromycin esterase
MTEMPGRRFHRSPISSLVALVSFLALLPSAVPQSQQAELPADQRDALVRDIKARAIPFQTVQAGSGFDDLAPLTKTIGDARIVALGEASHGDAEAFKMKHRLLEFLVEKMGFTVFAIEANWPESQVADRYIKGGDGDAATALRAMYFWTWQTEEVRDMVEWMRAYNLRPGDHPILTFTSFDMQSADVALKRVLDVFEKLQPAEMEAVQKLYANVPKKRDYGAAAKLSPEEKTKQREDANAVIEQIDARKDAFLKILSPEAFRDFRQCTRIVAQVCEMNAVAGYGVRDRCMAENVKWLAEVAYPGQKLVLWAHNGHVSTAPYGVLTSPMGMNLRKMFGSKLVVFGFASDKGEIRAFRMKNGKFVSGGPVAIPLPAARQGSSEALFRDVAPRFILDLRGVPADSPLGKWLAAPQPHRSAEAGYDPDMDAWLYPEFVLPKAYDGIIFIAESRASHALR